MNYKNIELLSKLENEKKELEKLIDELKKPMIEELKKKGTYSTTIKQTEHGEKIVEEYRMELANGKAVVLYVNNPRYGVNSKKLKELYPDEVEECSEFSNCWTFTH